MPRPDMRASGPPFALILALAFSAASQPSFAATPPPDPWTLARNLDLSAAASALEELHEAAPADARLAIAHAAGLLARQPRTSRNVADARALLEKTASLAPARDTKDWRPLARFMIARIDHDHLDTPDIPRALAGYEALRRDYPGHPVADQAAVHLGFILAYQTPERSPLEAAPELEALLAATRAPSAVRELHILIGRIHARADEPAEALPHYQAALAIPSETPHRDGDIELAVATLASRLGQNELAARHYLAFAESRPVDARAGTARRLAAEARSAARR